MLTGHNYIVFRLESTEAVIFPGHVLPPRTISVSIEVHAQIPGYIRIPFPVPDVHSASLIIPLSQAVSVFSFPDIFPASPDSSNTITFAWFSSAYSTIAPAVFLPSLCSDVLYMLIFLCLRRAMFSGICDPSQCVQHPVFSLGCIYESSSQDSSVRARMIAQTASY